MQMGVAPDALLTQSSLSVSTTHEGPLLANIAGHNVLHAAAVVLAVSHEVQSRPSALLLITLDDLHTFDIGTEDLDRHFNSDTGDFISQKE